MDSQEAEFIRYYRSAAPEILEKIRTSPAYYEEILSRIDSGSRALGRVLLGVVTHADKAIANHCPAPYKATVQRFYEQIICDVMVQIATHDELSLTKCLAVLSLVSPYVKASHVTVMQRGASRFGENDAPSIARFENSFGLFGQILKMRTTTPEIQNELLAISRLSVEYACQNLQQNLHIPQQLMEEVLASLFLSRLYNISYWYIYGKQ